MSDPQTALDAAMAVTGVHVDLRRKDPRPIGCNSCKPAIAALLAALPPDWCGHGPVEIAEILRQNGHAIDLVRRYDEAETEIARLREALVQAVASERMRIAKAVDAEWRKATFGGHEYIVIGTILDPEVDHE